MTRPKQRDSVIKSMGESLSSIVCLCCLPAAKNRTNPQHIDPVPLLLQARVQTQGRVYNEAKNVTYCASYLSHTAI